MKKLVIVLGLVFAGFTLNAQEGISLKSAQVHQAFKSGDFTITVPEDVNAEQVESLEGYYKDYFTVAFNANTNQLSFKLNKENAASFRVVNRMMVGLNLKKFIVDGQEMTFDEMYEKYYN